MVKSIPEGYHSVTPSFTFKDSQKAIDFYKKAFGAKVLDLMKSPDYEWIRSEPEITNLLTERDKAAYRQKALTWLTQYLFRADADSAAATVISAWVLDQLFEWFGTPHAPMCPGLCGDSGF